MHDFWPSSGLAELSRRTEAPAKPGSVVDSGSERTGYKNAHALSPGPLGWLVPTDAWLRRFLALPELALQPESCRAERALHGLLERAPASPVSAAQIHALQDVDVQANYGHFLGFRDALLAAGTLEAYYLALIRGGNIDVPPLFIDLVVQALVHHLVQGSTDAFEVRAAELLFRPQRVSLHEGQTLCADAQQADLMSETAGFGDLGRLLVQNKVLLKVAGMTVLNADNSALYWKDAEQAECYAFVLDLTHEATTEVGHGLLLTTRRSHSGLAALARVLERWVLHFLGVTVRITAQQKIADPAWRWHVGLDAQSSLLLDDLYEEREVEPDRLARLLGLFRLEFANPLEMRADVAGKPVYLGLAMNPEQLLRLKPQNLLLNLPLAAPV